MHPDVGASPAVTDLLICDDYNSNREYGEACRKDRLMFYKDERLALFIDGSNLYAAAKTLGFDIDYKLLRQEFMRRGKLLRIKAAAKAEKTLLLYRTFRER